MPRPKKNNNNELIDKIKSIYPKERESIDNIIDINKIKNNTKITPTIITDKIGEYYYDSYGGIWNNNVELIGSYDDKNYFYNDIKKIRDKILNKKIIYF